MTKKVACVIHNYWTNQSIITDQSVEEAVGYLVMQVADDLANHKSEVIVDIISPTNVTVTAIQIWDGERSCVGTIQVLPSHTV